MTDNYKERILKTIRNYDMIAPGDTVLVAVSGGPDSVFLLHMMSGLKNKLKIKKIAVCNLDHGLRGKESRLDSDFVKKLAKGFGMEFVHKKIDLKKRMAKDLSTEESAREARYDFFKVSAKKAGANTIATGHTLGDQAETILMRLVKGASLKGLVGISPCREECNLKFIRPLLTLEKDEITRYLDDRNIAYRVDSSNLQPVYFRNIVRHEIIPFLEKYNPRLKRVLSSLGEHLREDLEFIEEAKARVKKTLFGSACGAEIKLKDIIVQPKAIQKEILRDFLEASGGSVKKLSFKHWKELENLIRHKRKGNSVDLPGSIRVTRTDDRLIFKRI